MYGATTKSQKKENSESERCRKKLPNMLRPWPAGYASLIPKGMLARLGAALPPACTFLRLDGFGYQDCGRLEAELRAVVAGRAGMHVAVTQPNVSGCRWDQR